MNNCVSIDNTASFKRKTFNDFSFIFPKMYLQRILDKDTIEFALEANPKIKEILSEGGLPSKIYMENLQNKNLDHFLLVHKGIERFTPYLNEFELKILSKAALLHDIGKVFIPFEILNKKGELSEAEKEIVSLHSILGAEILKAINLSFLVVEAVKLHHIKFDSNEKQNNKIAQILSVLDVYSALIEERPYKSGFLENKARKIIRNDSKLNPLYVEYFLNF